MKSKQHETPSKTTKKPAKTKDEYIESLAAELKEWSVRIDRLTDKMENAAGDVKLKYVFRDQAVNKVPVKVFYAPVRAVAFALTIHVHCQEGIAFLNCGLFVSARKSHHDEAART